MNGTVKGTDGGFAFLKAKIATNFNIAITELLGHGIRQIFKRKI